jgi:hypothetical protein
LRDESKSNTKAICREGNRSIKISIGPPMLHNCSQIGCRCSMTRRILGSRSHHQPHRGKLLAAVLDRADLLRTGGEEGLGGDVDARPVLLRRLGICIRVHSNRLVSVQWTKRELVVDRRSSQSHVRRGVSCRVMRALVAGGTNGGAVILAASRARTSDELRLEHSHSVSLRIAGQERLISGGSKRGRLISIGRARGRA